MPDNLNLDVTVRLRDDAAGATRVISHIQKLADAARRLSRTGTDRSIRGLAKSVASLDRATTETGASRLARVAGSVRGLGNDAGRIDGAAKAIGALSRSFAKLSTTAEAAEKAAGGLTMMREALAHMPATGGFVNETNRELRETLDLQRRAIAGMRALNAGNGGSGGNGGGGRPRNPGNGGGRGRGHGSVDSMMGHAFFGATSGITLGGEAIREVYRQGAERVDEYVKMQMAGVDAAQIAANRAAAVATARIVGGSGINQNLATLRHLRFALGSDEEATRSLMPVAQATQTMRAMNPGLDAEGNAFAMAKAAEMKGVSQDPAKFRSYMGLMANTAIATGGKTTGRDFQQFTAMSKGTSTFLTPEAYAGLVSSIGGELGAGKTGNALAMSTRANIGGVMTEKGRSQLEGLGLWDSRSKTIKNGDSFQADPHKWVEDHLIPVLKANGMLKMDQEGNVDPEKSKEVGKLFAKMFSNSNVASFFTLLTTQGRRYEKDQALRTKVAVDNFAMQQKSPTYAMGAMTTAFKDMLGTMSEADMPELIAGLNALTKAFNGIAGMDPKSLGLVTEIGGAFLALGPSIWAARLAYMTFIKPLRELPALLRVSTTAIRAIVASEWAASAATMAWNGSALILSTTLGRLLATLTAVTAGFKAGTWLSKQADKIDAQADDKGASPRALQAETMARQRDLAKQNQLWNTPGLGFWAHFKAGQAAEDDRRYLDARGQPYEGAPVAGHRARGGPVSGGSRYLVGEHGPELFTPGMSGGIMTNADLNRLAEGTDGDASGQLIARAIRYQTFALTNAILAIAASNRAMPYAAAGEGAGGGGGGGGGGDGGEDGEAAPGPAVGHGGGRYGLFHRNRSPSGGFRGRGGGGGGEGGGGLDLSGDAIARATSLIKSKEGFQARGKWDRTAFRNGYGSDTMTDEQGHTHRVREGEATDRAGADRDLARRVKIFAGQMARQAGVEHWKKLSPDAQAALTSLGYNYGGMSKLSGLRSAIATEDPHKIAEAVRGLQGHNGGINRKRRLQEADLIERGGTPENPTAHQPQSRGMQGQLDADGAAVSRRMQTLHTLNKQCVSLARAAVNSGKTVFQWRPGDSPEAGTLKPGTPMATFLDRQGRQSGRYAGGGQGTMGAGLDHAGVFEQYLRDRAGKIVGFKMAEQYKKLGHVQDKDYYFGQGRGEHDASNYRAIKEEDGSYLGGDRNPMNRREPAPQVPPAVAERARGQHAERQAMARSHMAMAAASKSSGGGAGGHRGPMNVAINVNPHPHHDEQKIADAVHRKFNESAQRQLSDGVFV